MALDLGSTSDKIKARTTATTMIAKLFNLNPGEYDLWLMRIEQYFLMTDYSLWEVIKNGNKVLKKTVRTVEHTYKPTFVKERLDRKNEMKARGTLLMALPNKDQLKLHSYQDEKLIMEAIKKRYGGNKESKKVQRTLLKQQYENFAASSSETLDQTFDRSKVECFNCHKSGHFARECRAPKNQENRGREYGRKTVAVENPTENALIAQDGFGGYDWSYQYEEEHPINYALMALTSLRSSFSSDSEENVKSRSDKGYHAVPPPYTGNYIPPKPDLMFIDEQVESQTVDVVSNVSSSAVKTVESVDAKNKGVYSTIETKLVRKNNFSPLIIEDWNSNDESEVEFEPKVEIKTVRPCIEKIKFVKTVREKVEKYDCDKRVVRPVWNNSRTVNHKNFANKITHPHPKRKFVPQAILTKSGKLKTTGTPVNTVRPVNTADSKPIMNYSRPISNAFKRKYSQAIKPFNNYSAYKKTIFNKEVNGVKALTCWVYKTKHSSASITFKKYSYIDARGRSKSIMAWIPKRV
nr:hypothetical protein [Tanacetum cinerariifolium]